MGNFCVSHYCKVLWFSYSRAKFGKLVPLTLVVNIFVCPKSLGFVWFSFESLVRDLCFFFFSSNVPLGGFHFHLSSLGSFEK